MKQRVSIATASAFLALVIRRTLARSAHLEPTSDARDAQAALAVLRDPTVLAIVDAELLHLRLHEAAAGPSLSQEIVRRRAPTIVVDARARGVPEEVTRATSMVVVRGRLAGELDVGVIETELLAAVGSALRDRPLASEAKSPSKPASQSRADLYETIPELIVLGVSTGGPSLLLQLLFEVSEPAIPMLIVQHMPASETAGFAAQLSEDCRLAVREVAGGPLPPAGTIGLLRGGSDFRVVRRGAGLQLRDAVIEGNPFHPNIDQVLTSAVAAGVAVAAAILTGMGQDGAAGALAMADKGMPVIAQRPDTCTVAGMPQAVIDNGAARWVQSPSSIATTLNRWSDARRAVLAGETT